MFKMFRIERLFCKIRLKKSESKHHLENTYCTAQLLNESGRNKKWKDLRDSQEQFLKSITVENQDEHLANSISPFWHLTYDEQLAKKQNKCESIISRIEKRARSINNPMKCNLLQIVPSPVTNAYRSKDELTVRHGVDGNPKTVGFLIGKLSLGRAICVRPTHLVTIRESHKRVAQVYEDFIRLSTLPACLDLYDGGHWRSLIVRSNEAGEVMASVTVHPAGHSHEVIQQEQQNMKEYFFKHLPNITLFHQVCPHTRCTHDMAPFTLLYGEKPYLMETLQGYEFKISPDTFFQINKRGAEVLYDTVIRIAKLKPNSTLLDLCSGTGTISILASKFVRGAVGIESVPQSVKDAKFSAKLNNVTNVDFLMGRVESKLRAVLASLNSSTDIVAIVNPGRAGLGLDVINLLRQATQISRLVYISCKPDSPSTIKNFVALSSYSTSPFPPFTLKKAVPVDLFPQTEHIELVLLFHR